MINIYLCGAMQGVADRGAGWRDQLCKLVDEHNAGKWTPIGQKTPGGSQSYSVVRTPEEDQIHVFYPQRMEESILKYTNANTTTAESTEAMRAVILKDLSMIRRSDAVIAYVDAYFNQSAGSLAEATYAFVEGVPVIGLVYAQDLSPWVHWDKARDWTKACFTMHTAEMATALSMAIVAAKRKIFKECYANPERPLPI